MKNEIFIKDIPSYIIYYCDGMIEDFSKITEFVLQAGTECAKTNPNLKCITPDYCYISYLDGEYKEKDIKIRYAQAVRILSGKKKQYAYVPCVLQRKCRYSFYRKCASSRTAIYR